MDDKYLVIDWSKNYETWASTKRERQPVYKALEHATQICADHDQQPHIEVWDGITNRDDVEAALDDCDACWEYRWIDRDRLKDVEAEDTEELEFQGIQLLYGPDFHHYIAD